jgi:hypothetical protein
MSVRFCTKTKQRCSKGVTLVRRSVTLEGMKAIELSERIVLHAEVSRESRDCAKEQFRRSTEIVSREIAGETVVVPICRGVGDLDSIFTFNGMGSWLWSLLAEKRSEGELTELVAGRFAVEKETARLDVRNFLMELRDAGLVRAA